MHLRAGNDFTAHFFNTMGYYVLTFASRNVRKEYLLLVIVEKNNFSTHSSTQCAIYSKLNYKIQMKLDTSKRAYLPKSQHLNF